VLHELPLFKKGGFKRGFGGGVGQYAHNYNQLCLAVAQSVVPERAIEQCVQDSKTKRLEKNKREREEKRERGKEREIERACALVRARARSCARVKESKGACDSNMHVAGCCAEPHSAVCLFVELGECRFE